MADPSAPDDRYAKKWRAMVGISLLSFVVFIDYGIVNTILPGIQADLQADLRELRWVMNGFYIAIAMFMVTMGRLGDIYGRRKVLYIGVVCFGALSALAGASINLEMLIALRILQGVVGAIALTCAAALVTNAFPEDEQGKAFGIFMSVTAVGMAVGPVLGGFFLTFLNWRWAFFVNVPVIVLGFLVSWNAVRETPRQLEERVDWKGLCLLVPAIGCLILAAMQGNVWGWFSPTLIGLYIATVVTTVGFVLVERRVEQPIIDFSLFKVPMFQFGMVAVVAMGGWVGIGLFLPPLFLVNIQGQPGYLTGLMLLPITGLVMLIPPIAGKWVDKWGPVPFILVGQFIYIVAAITQSQFVPDSPVWFVLIGLGLFGLAWGIQQGASPRSATMAVSPAAAGLALGALWTVWNIANSLALSVGGIITNTVDHERLAASLTAANITLTDQQQHIIRSLLSDPSQAQQLLGELPANLATEVAPLFRQSFMDGYSNAMLFMAALSAVTFVGVVLLSFRVRAAARAATDGSDG